MLKTIFCLVLSLVLSFLVQTENEDVNDIYLELIASSKVDAPLTNVMSLDAKAEGSSVKIYLADIFTSSVLEVSRDGNILYISDRIGRSGKGPGEFEDVTNIQILQNGSLLVYDRNLGRVTNFDNSMTQVARMFSIFPDKSQFFPMEMYHYGSKEDVFYALSKKYFRASDNFEKQRKVLLQNFNPKGVLIEDSVLVKPRSEALVVTEGGNMAVNPNPAFGKKSIFNFHNENIFYGWTGSKKIEIYSYNGEHEKTIDLQLTKKNITDSDIELAEKASFKPFGEAIGDWAPDYWPFFHYFLIDDSGRFWIAESSHLNDEIRSWHVLSPDGQLIKKIDLPARLELFQIKNGYAFGVFTDDKNRPIIQLYRLIEK